METFAIVIVWILFSLMLVWFVRGATLPRSTPNGPAVGDSGYIKVGIPGGGIGKVVVVSRGYWGEHDAISNVGDLLERGALVRVVQVQGSILTVENAFPPPKEDPYGGSAAA